MLQVRVTDAVFVSVVIPKNFFTKVPLAVALLADLVAEPVLKDQLDAETE